MKSFKALYWWNAKDLSQRGCKMKDMEAKVRTHFCDWDHGDFSREQVPAGYVPATTPSSEKRFLPDARALDFKTSREYQSNMGLRPVEEGKDVAVVFIGMNDLCAVTNTGVMQGMV